jgi:hypothetical protein
MPDYNLSISSNSYPVSETTITSFRGVVDNRIPVINGFDLMTGYPNTIPKEVRNSAVYINRYTLGNLKYRNLRTVEDLYFNPTSNIANVWANLSSYITRVSNIADPADLRLANAFDGPRTTAPKTVFVTYSNVAANIDLVTSNTGGQIKFSVSNSTSNTSSLAMTINNNKEVVVVGNVATGRSLLGIGSLANISGNIPASSSSVGTKGQIAYSSGNVYICVATNTWVRTTAVTSF